MLEELAQIFRHALPYDGNGDPTGYELVVMIAQLRDVPSAERSAVVTKEDEGERAARPQI
jgi:hypothetical protein